MPLCANLSGKALDVCSEVTSRPLSSSDSNFSELELSIRASVFLVKQDTIHILLSGVARAVSREVFL